MSALTAEGLHGRSRRAHRTDEQSITDRLRANQIFRERQLTRSSTQAYYCDDLAKTKVCVTMKIRHDK
jgi:hypothetical protein